MILRRRGVRRRTRCTAASVVRNGCTFVSTQELVFPSPRPSRLCGFLGRHLVAGAALLRLGGAALYRRLAVRRRGNDPVPQWFPALADCTSAIQRRLKICAT